MTTDHGTHSDLHSEQGALRGEHPGRAKNPLIKVVDLAWLEFEKPDLVAAETFALTEDMRSWCLLQRGFPTHCILDGGPTSMSFEVGLPLLS